MQRDALLDLRLKAWARIMKALPESAKGFSGTAADILFLTDSQGVMDQIQDVFPEARNRLEAYPLPGESLPEGTADNIPPWLAERLTSRSGSGSGQETYAPARFDLIEIPGMPVEGFFSRLSHGGCQEDGDPNARPSAGSCWVGYLSWPGGAEGAVA